MFRVSMTDYLARVKERRDEAEQAKLHALSCVDLQGNGVRRATVGQIQSKDGNVDSPAGWRFRFRDGTGAHASTAVRRLRQLE